MKHNNRLTIAIASAALAALASTAAATQDKYSLKSPGGIAFADFRGYEDWATISSAKTDVLKNIVGNPAISIPVEHLDGLPVGMQVIGRHHEDALLLDLALIVERERPWPLVAPGSPV